jgi:molybdopterin-guanine dinucleotide biosynthesis protein A
MKTIVISGASSGVGKTTLARQLARMLPNATIAKIGHGTPKDNDIPLYQSGTSFEQIQKDFSRGSFLIIESNSILEEFSPDMTIFLDGISAKPSALHARRKADIISDIRVNEQTIRHLAENTGLSREIIRRIAWLSGARPEPVTGIILAGGKSSRMGKDKSMLDIRGKPALRHLFDQLSLRCDNVLISAARQTQTHIAGACYIIDKQDGLGPLMGIYTALTQSDSRVNFVIACDIPHFDHFLFRQLLSYSDTHDVVVPSILKGMREPLFGVYTRQVVPAAGMLLAGYRLRISELFERCATRVIEATDAGWYANLNTPEEYESYITREKVAV